MTSGRADGGEHDQRDVDEQDQPRVLDPGRGQHEQADELDDGDAEVAAAGVEPERPALEPVGVEGVDVGHRAGEVAAADAGEAGRRPAAS